MSTPAVERPAKALPALLAEAGWNAESQALQGALRDVAITDLTLDSRRAGPGSGFLALRGATTHGLRFAEQALNQGAPVVLFDSADAAPYPTEDARCIELPGLQQRCNALASALYGDARPARLLAVTGTDGKTTTSHWLAAVLEHAGLHSAVIGTLGSGDPVAVRAAVATAEAAMTTPDGLQLRALLSRQSGQGFEACVMEASSHALAQGRLEGISVDVAVLTHLACDHLDYHGTLDAYRGAKAQLFQTHAAAGVWVLNVDDALGRSLWSDAAAARIGYSGTGPQVAADGVTAGPKPQGRDDELWQVTKLQADGAGLRAEFAGFGAGHEGEWSLLGRWTVEAPVFGAFQIQNLAAVWCAARASGLSAEIIAAAFRTLPGVPGRMEAFHPGADAPTVIVDYAHTEGALRAVLQALDGHVDGRLLCLFGCGGDRDRSKRAAMGAVAAQHADVVIVTDDNPRSEAPAAIRAEILDGAARVVDARARQIDEQPGREEAIRRVLALARPRDLVVLAGKGHETTQEIAGQRLPLSDRLMVAQWVAQRPSAGLASGVRA